MAVDIYGNTSRYSTWYWAATHLAGDVSFVCPTLRTATALGARRVSRANNRQRQQRSPDGPDERQQRSSHDTNGHHHGSPAQQLDHSSEWLTVGGSKSAATAPSTAALYLYHFNHKPRWGHFTFAGLTGVPESAGIFHASELLFVFDGNPPATHAQAPKYVRGKRDSA